MVGRLPMDMLPMDIMSKHLAAASITAAAGESPVIDCALA